MSYTIVNPEPPMEKTVGSFIEKTGGRWFFYAPICEANKAIAPEGFDFEVRVSDNPIGMSGRRFAKVLKTVAYVVTDENDDGSPVVEKWDIKSHTRF